LEIAYGIFIVLKFLKGLIAKKYILMVENQTVKKRVTKN
jgi:hypothetical protein